MSIPQSELAAAFTAGHPEPFNTLIVGHPVVYVPTVESTQPLVHERAQQGAAEGLVVVTDEQTAGRGRLDRAWQAPFGTALLMSLLLRPELSVRQAARLTMCAGLGAAEGIEAATGLKIGIKWPNDLLLDGNKLAGILTETEIDGERLVYAVVGLGINVNVTFDAQHELAGTATSLSMALGRPLDRLAVLRAVLERIDTVYGQLKTGQSPYSRWMSRLVYLGLPVQVTTPASRVTGVAVGVNEDGALLLDDEAGRRQTIWAGDVIRLHAGDDRPGNYLPGKTT